MGTYQYYLPSVWRNITEYYCYMNFFCILINMEEKIERNITESVEKLSLDQQCHKSDIASSNCFMLFLEPCT